MDPLLGSRSGLGATCSKITFASAHLDCCGFPHVRNVDDLPFDFAGVQHLQYQEF